MKKLIATVICLVALIAGSVMPAAAQTRNRRTYQERPYNQRYDNRAQDRYWDEYYNRDRSVWDKHRDKITTAGGAVGGAIIGGLIGGKKGALIGALAGGGGAALYTYKVRDKNQRY